MAPSIVEVSAPTPIGVAPSGPIAPTGGIAAALVNVAQGMMLGNGDAGPSGANPTLGLPDLAGLDTQEQLESLISRLHVETRIKEGAENLLQVLESESQSRHDGKELAKQVAAELQTSKIKIANINRKLDEVRESMPGPSNGLRRPVNGESSGNTTDRGTPFSRRAGADGMGGVGLFDPPRSRQKEPADQEDIRTSLAQATTLINTLAQLNTTPLSPSVPGSTAAKTATAKRDKARIELMNDLVSTFESNIRVRYMVDTDRIADVIIPALCDDSSKEARAAAYRVIRHAIVDFESAAKFRHHGVDWYLVRTLARDTKHGLEKEHALKLIALLVDLARHFTSSHHSHSHMDEHELELERANSEYFPVSDSIVRALIAVAEYPEDPMRLACLMLIADLMLFDIELVWRNGGMRVLLLTLTEGPADIAPEIAMALLNVVDLPRTRVFLDAGVDLEMALAGFTDAYGKGTGNADRMKASSKVITIMLRTWSGLMYLCMDDMKAIKSLIDTLRIRSLDTREVILDTFFEVLKIKTPDWYNTFLEGRRLTMYRHKDPSAGGSKAHGGVNGVNGHGRGNLKAEHDALKITDQFLGLLLVVVSDSGLLDALVGILEEVDCDPNIWRKATLLLGEILYMSNRLLPLAQAAKLQSLPRLFELAAAYGRKSGREIASSAFSSIDSFNRNRARLQQQVPTTKDLKRGRANSVEDSVRRNQRQADQARIQYGMQIDDKSFQTLLIDTQVMAQSDHKKWNFDILSGLIEGPLLNPKRLEEAMKGSRFGRKLMSFFHPRSRRFSNIEKSQENMRWVRLACSLVTTLVTSPEGHGVRFLATEDPLLPQLASCFSELLPFQGAPALDPIFSAKRVETTLTSGYFEIIGILSRYPEGIELMERHKLFTAFYHVTELRSRDDLIKGIIKNLDYTIDGHPRVVLSKALTSSTKDIRLNATQHLGQLIRASPKANEWTLRLLLTQLYDPDMEVATLAMKYLEDVCEDVETLELVVKMQPTLDHLGDIGHALLLRFMSTSVGFRYLYHSGYIDREVESWFHDRNFIYVVQVETYLANALGSAETEGRRRASDFEGMVPPHFYGEMAKSALGAQVLQEKGHFADFADFIRQHGLEDDDVELISKLKSVLWAVGNIGGTIDGLLFLEEEEIIPVIVDIAENSPVLSVRGTCFYVLGLISSTDQGTEVLIEYGWEATLTPLRTATGLCLPQDIAKFLHVPPWDCPDGYLAPIDVAQRLSGQPLNAQGGRAVSKRAATRAALQDFEREILDAISNLSNTVIANEAARSLGRLKSRHPSSFQSIPLLAHVMRVLATERYRLPVRRYILDQLFGVNSPPASNSAPAPIDGTDGGAGISMTPENMRALQDEVAKLEAQERAFDRAEAEAVARWEEEERSVSPAERAPRRLTTGADILRSMINTNGVVDGDPAEIVPVPEKKPPPTGGSVLAKYAPVRRPCAPTGVPRLDGFDA